jgi:hypothetical protein
MPPATPSTGAPVGCRPRGEAERAAAPLSSERGERVAVADLARAGRVSRGLRGLAARAEAGRCGSVRAEGGREAPKDGRADMGRVDGGRADMGRADCGRADCGRVDGRCRRSVEAGALATGRTVERGADADHRGTRGTCGCGWGRRGAAELKRADGRAEYGRTGSVGLKPELGRACDRAVAGRPRAPPTGRPMPAGRAEAGRLDDGARGRLLLSGSTGCGGPSVSGLASRMAFSAARLGSSRGMSHGGARTPPAMTARSFCSSSASRFAVVGTIPSFASPDTGMRMRSISLIPWRRGASAANSEPPTNSSHRCSVERLLSAVSSFGSTIAGPEREALRADGRCAARPSASKQLGRDPLEQK